MFMIVVVVVLMLEEVLLVLLVSKLHVVQPSPRVWGVLTMGDLATSLPPSTKRPSLVECTMESTTKVQEEEQEIIEQEKEAQTFLLILLVIHVVFLLPLHMYRYVLG